MAGIVARLADQLIVHVAPRTAAYADWRYIHELRTCWCIYRVGLYKKFCRRPDELWAEWTCGPCLRRGGC